MARQFFILIVLALCPATLFSQPADLSPDSLATSAPSSGSLLDELESFDAPAESAPAGKFKKPPVYNTFGGTHLINGQSTETIGKNVMAFIIAHRFGRLNSGWRELFGLDQASMRMSFEYGILDNLTIGIGRSSFTLLRFKLKHHFYFDKEKKVLFLLNTLIKTYFILKRLFD